MYRWRSPLDKLNHLLDLTNKNKSRLKFLYSNLNDYSSMIKVIENSKPNYVFHLAAQSYPQTSFNEGNITLETNIIGTCNLLNAIKLKKLNTRQMYNIGANFTCSVEEMLNFLISISKVKKIKIQIDKNRLR